VGFGEQRAGAGIIAEPPKDVRTRLDQSPGRPTAPRGKPSRSTAWRAPRRSLCTWRA